MSLGLLGAYISSSDDSNSSEDEQDSNYHKEENVKKLPLSNPFNDSASTSEAKLLPRPSFMVDQKDFTDEKSKTRENSVFNNPFRAKEDQKKAILERHVTMTTKQEDQRTIDGKKVCWNFRKGRCRFGSKCTFAHDSDVKQKPTQDDHNKQSSNNRPNSLLNNALQSSEPQIEDNEGVIENNKKPKKRPGLSQGLVPSKKAMKFYDKVYGGNQ